MQVGCAGEQQAKCEVDDPAKAGCHKQKVKQAEPDGGHLVDERDDRSWKSGS